MLALNATRSHLISIWQNIKSKWVCIAIVINRFINGNIDTKTKSNQMIEHGDWSNASNCFLFVLVYFFCARWITLNGIVMHTVALNEMIWIGEQVEVIYKKWHGNVVCGWNVNPWMLHLVQGNAGIVERGWIRTMDMNEGTFNEMKRRPRRRLKEVSIVGKAFLNRVVSITVKKSSIAVSLDFFQNNLWSNYNRFAVVTSWSTDRIQLNSDHSIKLLCDKQ